MLVDYIVVDFSVLVEQVSCDVKWVVVSVCGDGDVS